MDGTFRVLIALFLFPAVVFHVPGSAQVLVPAAEGAKRFGDVTHLNNDSSSNSLLEGGFDQPRIETSSTSEILNTNLRNESVAVLSDTNITIVNISDLNINSGNISDLNINSGNINNASSYDEKNVTTTGSNAFNVNETDALIDEVKADASDNSSAVTVSSNISNIENINNFHNSRSKDSYLNTSANTLKIFTDNTPPTTLKNTDNIPLTIIENYEPDESQSRGDMDPLDIAEDVEDFNSAPVTAESTHQNFTAFADILAMDRSFLYGTMSWLDVFMLEQRGPLWVIFNTLFMVIWILIGIFSLYRLLGLPYCSPYISRTKYLVIHLLIFTASTFEFVQLIHFSYGSHEGLPLFLTLLLTHTPTPCLAAALILTVYCVFVAARVPMFVKYLPPIIYVSILISFIIVLSFVGDIIVGVTRNSIILIVCRASLLVLCLICLLAFIINYRKIVGVALLMRREFRGELKSLAIPVDSGEENQDSSLHLKKILIIWTRMTLLGCLCGIFMCLFSFCLSLFFTVSFVPLWAFWVLHTALFVAQVLVVFSITFGATYTLTYNSRENIFQKYFLPSLVSNISTNRSFIKRGNFIYQRVSVANGPTAVNVTPTSVPPTIMENVEHSFLPNNNLITDLSASPFRPKVNLKRSATFNCTSPYYGFHQSPCAPFTPNLYPVLSDHILPYSQTQLYHSFNRHEINNAASNRAYSKPTLQYSNSFSHNVPNRAHDMTNIGHRHPMKSFPAKDRFVDLDSISKGSHPKETPSAHNSLSMAGSVEPLEVAYAPINIIPIVGTSDQSMIRQIPYNHSFNAADRYRYKQGPPEKPARRNEPILVKGVIKDNSYVKSTLPVSEAFYPDKSLESYSIKDSSRSPDSAYYAYRGKSPLQNNVNLAPGLNSCLESINTSTPIPVSKTSFSTITPAVSPISSRYQSTSANSPFDRNVSPNYSSVSGFSNHLPLGNNSLANGTRMTVLKDQDGHTKEPLPEVPSLFGKPEIIDADLSVSADDTHVSTDSSPIPKRHSLRRNHSTAGDFPARDKDIETEDESTSGDFPQAVNGFKHPWYGTWGGRRKSKRKSSTNVPDTTSTSTLRRLSASKSSLSSIYEKLKPKRNKAAYRHAQTDDCYDPSSETNENSSISQEELEEVEVVVEEEEEFLPRLDEDIDLAADILRSSTVLADFYSLDRSYLKKRKKDRMRAHEEEHGALEMNGINTESINYDDSVDDVENGKT